MLQQTFAEAAFEPYRKPASREWFLGEMRRVVQWREMVAVIEPVYPKADGSDGSRGCLRRRVKCRIMVSPTGFEPVLLP